ncbi:MAG: hypothetical protein A3E84_00730 [Gammaproteobacteria bacterium RIFCSPHIGHO2_12_FULL_42_13]|nr:MAG: hypothetical protein A3E84_00730 [Gammaproteobacteria bacterium RIFCSPHIGHO2_12_FULL_42_13]
MRRHCLRVATDLLAETLTFARDTAMTAHTIVTVSPDGKDWREGIRISDATPSSNVLRVMHFPGYVDLSWQASFGETKLLRYRPDGFTYGQQGNFQLCVRNGMCAKVIVLSTGRLRVVI